MFFINYVIEETENSAENKTMLKLMIEAMINVENYCTNTQFNLLTTIILVGSIHRYKQELSPLPKQTVSLQVLFGLSCSKSWRKKIVPPSPFTAICQVTVTTCLLLFLTYGCVSLSITVKEEIWGGDVTAQPVTWRRRTSHTDVTAYYRCRWRLSWRSLLREKYFFSLH